MADVEREAAEQDFALFGLGVLVDGKRVDPRRVQFLGPAIKEPADDVLQALDLNPERYRTEGGAINRNKLRATILNPSEYLPADHWLNASVKEAAPASGALPPWTSVKDRMPAAGTLIVKRWKINGAVWAGFYHGTSKESSFDEWLPLPAADSGSPVSLPKSEGGVRNE